MEYLFSKTHVQETVCELEHLAINHATIEL